MNTLTIKDETLGKGVETAFTLDCLTEELSVREVIRQRVYQEVQDYNRALSQDKPPPRLLVSPNQEEQLLNQSAQGGPKKSKRVVKWEKQFEVACDAFEKNGYFVVVGDRQAEDLDEVLEVKVDTEVTFIKLVPLVGG